MGVPCCLRVYGEVTSQRCCLYGTVHARIFMLQRLYVGSIYGCMTWKSGASREYHGTNLLVAPDWTLVIHTSIGIIHWEDLSSTKSKAGYL